MLNNIQVLRAAAALAVALAHLVVLNSSLQPLGYGTFGVELFFVISGFVMVYITSQRPISPWRFFANRVARIMPLYWLLTIGIFCLAALAPSLFSSTRAVPSELLRSLLFIPFVKESGLTQPLLFVGWTLNYEMFFYLLFALALALPGMRLRVVVLSTLLISLVGFGLVAEPQSVFGRFYTAPIMLEFVYGMILGLAYGRMAAVPGSIGPSAILLGLVLLPLLSQVHVLAPFKDFIRGGCAMLIVFGTLVLQAKDKVMAWRPALLLGSASYALYLVHPFAFIPIEKGARHFGLLDGIPLVLVLTTAVLAMLGAGILLHVLVELHMAALLKRASRIGKRTAHPA